MLSFVIINYNDYENTSKLLENVKSYKCLDNIVIVDNNSTDDSMSRLKKLESKKVIVLENSSNHLSSGWNLAAKYLVEKKGHGNIIFSNADIEIEKEEDLIKLSNDTKKHNIGVVAPTINEHGIIKKAWPVPNTKEEILFNIPLISRYFKNKYLKYDDSHYEEDLSIVGAVSGCFFLVNSKLLEEIDYFDTNTRIYYEENILSKKVEKTNFQIAIDNNVYIKHNHSVTIDKSLNRVKKYKLLKQSQHYYVKNYLKANSIELALLFITNKLSLFILYIRSFWRR